MTSSTLSLNHELPPAPPPTSDALDVLSFSNCSTDLTNKELNTSRNNCLLPIIESSGTLSKAETKPITNDFLPPDLLLALKRHEGTGEKPYTPHMRPSLSPRESQLTANVRNIKPPAKLWGYASRRTRLKHLTNAPPCICGAGKDISFLYDSPREKKQDSKQVRHHCSECSEFLQPWVETVNWDYYVGGGRSWIVLLFVYWGGNHRFMV